MEGLGWKLHLPHLYVNHDQNMRVGVEGVFSMANIHYDSQCTMSGFRVDGRVGVEVTSTPFTCKSRPKHAGRCGRGLFDGIHSLRLTMYYVGIWGRWEGWG